MSASARIGKPSVSVAIPAYNEAVGIGGFLQEIARALVPHVQSLRLVVVDDGSTDQTLRTLDATRSKLQGTALEVIRNRENRGHGPSLMTAYRAALAGNPDYVLQVDGDGQFHGSDLRRILVLLSDDAHAVSGVRRFRVDPWFRMSMSRVVRSYVAWGFAVRTRDPNCPLRGFEAGLLRDLLKGLPENCLIPNLYLTILACRHGVPLLEVDVSHRVRRGYSAQGTMWSGSAPGAITIRLVRFSVAAFRESLRFRGQMDLPDWGRDQEAATTSGEDAPEVRRAPTAP